MNTYLARYSSTMYWYRTVKIKLSKILAPENLSTVLSRASRYCTVLYCTVLYCTVSCTVLYYRFTTRNYWDIIHRTYSLCNKYYRIMIFYRIRTKCTYVFLCGNRIKRVIPTVRYVGTIL